MSQNKPVIAFLHGEPGKIPTDRAELSENGRERLQQFRELAQRRVCKYWDSAKDLGSVVSRSIVKLIKDRPATGWIRADRVPDETAAQEILRTKRRVEELEEQIKQSGMVPPTDTDNLAQGDEKINLRFRKRLTPKIPPTILSPTWNEIFRYLGPHFLDGLSDAGIRAQLVKFFWSRVEERLGYTDAIDADSFKILDEDYQAVRLQLRALGLIARQSTETWTLTPYGDNFMMKLNAIPADRGKQ